MDALDEEEKASLQKLANLAIKFLENDKGVQNNFLRVELISAMSFLSSEMVNF